MLLQSIARILVKYVGNAAGFGVAGDAIIDIWDLWSKSQQDQRQKLEEIQQLAGLSTAEARRHAAEVVAQEAAGQPETVRQALTAYLAQLPNSIQQSQRRPQDPSGRSVSAQLRLQRPEDLLVLLPARPPRFKVGDRPAGVGDWELEELLGMGGFGEVWKAKNPHMPSADRVALKFCLDPAAAKVLRHEAAVLDQVMRQGKHPGIVQLRHTYFSADVPCLEYEFVAGGDLTSLVHRQLQRNQGRLPVEMVTQIMRNITRAVRYAHRLTPPIVHRDLKPANILVQPRPDGKVELRIADFGIGGVASTCAIDQTRQGVSPGQFLTTAVRWSCTPHYCSPQQAHGEPPDPRDDVHALGVIWYQLLIGDLTSPASADWRDELAERQVPEAIMRLLGSCLSTKAEKRPADAGVLADEIDKLVLPKPPDQDMKEALEELRTRGDTRGYFVRQGPTRIAAWQAAAQKGDVTAQWLLARCLQEGAGVQKDAEAGLAWLRRAAESGLPVAQTDLGGCYYTGEGVEEDAGEAFRLYTAAAAQGFPEAQVDLGDCYCEGKGVAENQAEAARHYRMGAEAGWARGQDSLGHCYLKGSGVEHDQPQASGWYRRAAEQGLASAQHNLGWCYEYAKGVNKNWGEAAKWYRKAAEQGIDECQFALGKCYQHGHGIEQDLTQAEQWYRKAADQGYKKAKNALARLLKDEEVGEPEEGEPGDGASEQDKADAPAKPAAKEGGPPESPGSSETAPPSGEFPVIQCWEEIDENLRRLEGYLESANEEERAFAKDLVRRAMCFVVSSRGGKTRIGPSRFVGYARNTRERHLANIYKDGKETNPSISRVVDQGLVADPTIEEEYQDFCRKHQIQNVSRLKRKYWRVR